MRKDTKMSNAIEILECGHPESPHSNFTRGYGIDSDGKRHCYACCAAVDRAYMQDHGRITLYLVKHKEDDYYWITNWPGSLQYKAFFVKYGRHNWAGERVDVWFRDEQGATWHGTQYGKFTQLCHCKRLKGN